MQVSNKAQAISPSLTLGINALSSELRAQGKDVVGFGVGEPDFDTPAYIRQAAIEAIESGKTRYTPVPGIMDLRQAACDRYEHKYGLKFAPAQVVVSSGAKECLYNVFQVILNPGDEVIIISPYWLTYPEQVKMAGDLNLHQQQEFSTASHSPALQPPSAGQGLHPSYPADSHRLHFLYLCLAI